jgi:hypothetical protein
VKQAFLKAQRGGMPPGRPNTGLFTRAKSALGAMLTLIVHRPTAASAAVPGRSSALEQQSPVPMAPALPIADVASATPRPLARATARAVPGRPAGLSRTLVTAGAVILILLATGIPAIALLYFLGRSASPVPDGSSSSPNSLAFHRGSLQLITLYAGQRQQVDEIFRTADEEYRKIESRHTRLGESSEKEGRRIIVFPFKDEVDQLEQRVWTQLEAVLSQEQVRQARTLLPMRGSLFPFGQQKVDLEFCRTADGFGWRVLPEADGGKPPFTYGPQLPKEYERFWPEAAGRQ